MTTKKTQTSEVSAHSGRENQPVSVTDLGPTSRSSHTDRETRVVVAAAGSTSDGGGHRVIENQSEGAPSLGPILADPTLYVLASMVDDLEQVRKAADNRIRQLTRCEADEDGEVRGHCLPDDHPVVIKLRKTFDEVVTAESSSVKALEYAMKNHPLGVWVKNQNGLGMKTIARLLSSVGDPYWNTLYDRPRTVSELWAYCGLAVHGGKAQKRAKGEKANWSAEAKMRVWNCVQPIIKNAKSPYRAVYDAAKAHLDGAVYDEHYAGRKFKGKPIEVGQPLSKGHIDARAQRVVMKAILKDLWIESKRIHEEIESNNV